MHKEESDDRNESRVVESRGGGKTTGIYFGQGWSQSVPWLRRRDLCLEKVLP